MTTYYKDFCGATASITEHRNGTATLRVMAGLTRTVKKYKNKKSAYEAWRRMCR